MVATAVAAGTPSSEERVVRMPLGRTFREEGQVKESGVEKLRENQGGGLSGNNMSMFLR